MTTTTDRRTVFAYALLTGSPTQLAEHGPRAIRIEFATIADMRGWLSAAELDEPELLTASHTWVTDDGRTAHAMYAYPTDWHGWDVYAYAIEYDDPPILAEDLRHRLTAITGPQPGAVPDPNATALDRQNPG